MALASAGCQPVTFWKTFGGSGRDSASAVVQLLDGGYAAAGTTIPVGGQAAVAVVRTDVHGEPQWSKVYEPSDSDHATTLLAMPQNGLLIAGSMAAANPLLLDGLLLRLDSSGNEIWRRRVPGGDGASQYLWGLALTDDGGFVISGARWPGDDELAADILLVKTDAEGIVDWSTTFGGPIWEETRGGVAQAADGGYFVFGFTNSIEVGNLQSWLIKTDPQGHEEWNRTYGAAGQDDGAAVIAMPDGGAVIAGTSAVPSGTSFDNQAILARVDASGTTMWTRFYGDLTLDDHAFDAKPTPDGGFILTGLSDSSAVPDTGFDVLLVKTDADGNEEWLRYLGSPGPEKGSGVLVASDGGYAIGGEANWYGPDSQMLLIKTDAAGMTSPPPS